jgi:hypothetical protein
LFSRCCGSRWLRPALVVGMTDLILVILGIFIFMAVLKIDLQRVS